MDDMDNLIEAARCLGLVQARKSFGQYGPDDAASECGLHASISERSARLRAEVEALRADAQRYRWLKDHSAYTTVTPCIHGDAIGPSRMRWYHDSHQLHAFTLDAAIDAARAAQGVKP